MLTDENENNEEKKVAHSSQLASLAAGLLPPHSGHHIPTASMMGSNGCFPSATYPQAQFFGSNGADKPPISVAFYSE